MVTHAPFLVGRGSHTDARFTEVGAVDQRYTTARRAFRPRKFHLQVNTNLSGKNLQSFGSLAPPKKGAWAAFRAAAHQSPITFHQSLLTPASALPPSL
jgi:hypothetical protein